MSHGDIGRERRGRDAPEPRGDQDGRARSARRAQLLARCRRLLTRVGGAVIMLGILLMVIAVILLLADGPGSPSIDVMILGGWCLLGGLLLRVFAAALRLRLHW